jgi:uncharacterized membrane protein YkgB
MSIQTIENKCLSLAREWSVPFARFALFVLYFWFGLLKVIGLSPASGVVERLFNETLGGFISFGVFIILFGLFECLIGILFVIPRASRVALVLFAIHIVTTTGPLVLLPGEVWTAWFVPTMEGQYIIKNLALVAAALAVAANLEPQRQPA